MLRKVCPCLGCGINTMCVSHDSLHFYCNRCLPYFIRGHFYENQEPEEKKVETSSEPKVLDSSFQKTTTKTNKKTSKKTSKKS